MSQASAQAAASPSEDLVLEQNKAVIRSYVEEFWNRGRLELAEELLHPDLYCHPPSFDGPTGFDDMKGIVSSFRDAFPDGRFTTQRLIAEGDTVAVWLSFRGVHEKGEFGGVPASGKELAFEVLGYYRIQDGKIIEVRKLNTGHNHTFHSALGTREQLG